MKTRNLFLVILGVFISIGVAAQNRQGKGKMQGKTPEERAQKQTEHMTKYLDLSDEQSKKISEINLRYAKENETKKEAVKAEREKTKTAKDAELKKVLTPEQYAKFDQKRAENKAKKEAKRAERKEKMKRCMEEQKASEAPAK